MRGEQVSVVLLAERTSEAARSREFQAADISRIRPATFGEMPI